MSAAKPITFSPAPLAAQSDRLHKRNVDRPVTMGFAALNPSYELGATPIHNVKQRNPGMPFARHLYPTVALLPPGRLRRDRSFILLPPPRGDGGAPTGASLEHVALVRRDATLARRGPSRATGRPPLGAPPWRCRPRVRFRRRHCLPAPGAKAPRNRALPARPRPRASRVRGYEPRSTPHPAPPSGSSPETPLIERDVRTHTPTPIRSQYIYSSCR